MARLRWFLLLVALAAVSMAHRRDDASARYSQQELRIRMRDGVQLFTLIFTPRDTQHKLPFLIARTPYGVNAKDEARVLGGEFGQSEFIFVFQDVRGRYRSEGIFVEERPEEQSPDGPDESTDTYDTIEWLLRNIPNNNGKAGLRGISYPGFYADASLIHSHPALLAVSPQAPMADLFMGDDAYHNGAFRLLQNFDFYIGFGPQTNPHPGPEPKPFAYGTKNGYRFFLQMGALDDADRLYLKNRNPYWTDVIEHDTYDDYWRSRNIRPHLQHVTPAVLVVGGWFDAEDLAGTLNTYRTVREQSPETSVKFVMGPWSHGQWATPKAESLGGLKFGSNTSAWFRSNIELPFFLHYLKEANAPEIPPVTMFETGANQWQRAAQWPPAHALDKTLYLQAGQTLSFDPPQTQSGFDEYRSDPHDPVPFIEHPGTEMKPEYVVSDQRFASRRPDVLTFRTEPLKQSLCLAGPVAPALFVSSSGTDSDFIVKLIDENEKGEQLLVRGEPFRAKFRHSFEHPEAMRPGTVEQIRFTMPDVFHRFAPGHRVTVQIQSSWFPLIDRNPQTFVDIPGARPEDFVVATERVYHSSVAPSALAVSVLPGQ